MIERALIDVTGLVQGVGFRPFVHSLATSLDLRGFVQNRGSHLFVDVEGEPGALAAFVERLSTTAPPLAAIDRRGMSAHDACRASALHDRGQRGRCRVPRASAAGRGDLRGLPPRTVRSRQSPLSSPVHHLHHVRATIHDRQAVTVRPREHGDGAFCHVPGVPGRIHQPADRRFHAQAIACPECGPILVARDAAGVRARGEASLRLAVRTLLDGGILAVKGLGGYHLACDATSLDAVAELRRRKGRDAKPLAVMFPGTESLDVDGVTLAVLGSRERPIVLVDRSRVSGDAGAEHRRETVPPSVSCCRTRRFTTCCFTMWAGLS